MRGLLAALLGLAVALPAQAQQELPACPDSLRVTDAAEGAAPEDWQPFRRDLRTQLVDIRFYAGPPAEGRAVEPVAGSARGSVVSMRYGLPAIEGEVWMVCVYAATAHALMRRLEGPFSPHVRVNHDRNDGRTFITYN
ncbi:STY0301 family protein [Roseomonas rosulenta]|uniref:STY0301 family protein n=1 Tax=Roseomonas rosulenta TaxID=2748667 RepID=UPI0018DF5934|nr:STY0301 family protein [Roseomonas rosulenta]